jgi:ABC-type Mn2+/Zn2+ transport system permease subunit
MPRFGLKALFAVLMVNRSKRSRLRRDTIMLIFAVLLTLGLVILYLLTKIVSW